MRSDSEIKAEIQRLQWEAYNSADWEYTDEIDARIYKLRLELHDPAALVPETDLRESAPLPD